MTTELIAEIESFLGAQRTMVLATVGADGAPMTHAMHYVPEGLRLYLSSLPGTAKLANLVANPVVGYAVWRLPSYEHRDTMRSIQAKGRARIIDDPDETARLRVVMRERFPFAAELALEFNTWIAVEPTEILWLDGSKGMHGRFVLGEDDLNAG